MLTLKVVKGEDFLISPLIETVLETYAAGTTVKRSRAARALHTWAIKHGFVFRRDARMSFKGYYLHPQKKLYAAIM